jgi:hypothetical protein
MATEEITTQQLFGNYVIPFKPKTRHRSYRDEMVEKFMAFLKEPYFQNKGVALLPRLPAIKLAKLKDEELERFYQQCCASKAPAIHFWSSFKEEHWVRQEAFKKRYNIR